MQNFLVQGNLYQESGERCNGSQVKSLRLYAEIFTGQLVGGLQGISVISKLASRMVMPRGMACIFPRRRAWDALAPAGRPYCVF